MKLSKQKSRIIVFLSKVSIDKTWLGHIASKLQIEYHNCSRLLSEMVGEKLVLRSVKNSQNKIFFRLSYLGKNEVEYAESVIYGK